MTSRELVRAALAGKETPRIPDPPFVEALLEPCIAHASAYAVAHAEAAADMLSTGDSPAGMIGPDLYQEFALPAERRVFRAIHDSCDVPASLHICGDARHILAAMAASGADVLEIDHLVPLADACRVVPEHVALWGNLDPVRVILNGTPEAVKAAAAEALATVRSHGRRRFVLSSGCTLAPDTPADNITAFIRCGAECAPLRFKEQEDARQAAWACHGSKMIVPPCPGS